MGRICGFVIVGAMLVTGLWACDKSGAGELECSNIKVSDTCKVYCSRVKKENNKAMLCTKQLVAKGNSRNEIMHTDIKRVQTRKLSAEKCFEVKDGRVADPKAEKELLGICAGAGPMGATSKPAY